MVELVVYDFDEETELEKELTTNNIEYQFSFGCYQYGIKPPYLIVNGVPLDKKRALIWIKEHKEK